MKAVVTHEHGDIDKAVVEDMPEPELIAGEVIIKVHAAALNHLDLWTLKGRPGMELPMPHILGSDATGIIEAMGEGVHGMSVGEEVVVNPGLCCGCCEFCRKGEQSECIEFGIVGVARPGTFAEKVAVPARCVYPKPAHLDFKEAAALPLAHTTAWRMLFTRAKVRLGETVLIHGAGGGVAAAAIQLARLAGARVIATTSTEEKIRLAKALGAERVIHYKKQDVPTEVRKITKGRGVDVVFDAVGAEVWPIDLACARRGGRIVVCGVTTGAEAPTNLQAVYWNQLSIFGSTMGSDEDFRNMLDAVNASGLMPVVNTAEPIVRAREALTRMKLGMQFGKIVIRMV